jgi:hypothetical protein
LSLRISRSQSMRCSLVRCVVFEVLMSMRPPRQHGST